jgi:hypothetical protein
MMHNYFRCDKFCIVPGEGCLGIVGNFGQSFKQVRGLIGRAGEPPEVRRALERDANHVGFGSARLGWMLLFVIHRCAPF